MSARTKANAKEKHCQAHGKWGWCGNPVHKRIGRYWYCRRHAHKMRKQLKRIKGLNPKLYKKLAWGWCRRHKKLSIFGAALIVAYLTGTLTTLLLWSIPLFIFTAFYVVVRVMAMFVRPTKVTVGGGGGGGGTKTRTAKTSTTSTGTTTTAGNGPGVSSNTTYNSNGTGTPEGGGANASGN